MTDEELDDANALLDEIEAMIAGKKPDQTIHIAVGSLAVAVNAMRELVSQVSDMHDQARSMRRTIELADRLLAERVGIDTKAPIL